MRRTPALLALVLLLVSLTACSSVGGTGDRGYITTGGQVSELRATDRGSPIELQGADLDGNSVDLGSFRGQVVVINFWGSWCPPCRSEMPMLVAAAEDSETDARFLGVNVRDGSVENAQSFERAYDVPFPTLWDPDGRALLAFPTALVRLPPTTLVLDRQGRIAAYVIGELPSELTLRDLVDTVVSEVPAADSAEGTADG